MGIEEDDIDPTAFLEDVEMRVGEVTAAEPFPEARKDVYQLEVDFGEETLGSAAGLTDNYDPEELVGRQVLCAMDIGSVRIAGFKSGALTVGVPGNDGNPVLVTPDEEVPLGGVLY